jgi:hypothetical protein
LIRFHGSLLHAWGESRGHGRGGWRRLGSRRGRLPAAFGGNVVRTVFCRLGRRLRRVRCRASGAVGVQPFRDEAGDVGPKVGHAALQPLATYSDEIGIRSRGAPPPPRASGRCGKTRMPGRRRSFERWGLPRAVSAGGCGARQRTITWLRCFLIRAERWCGARDETRLWQECPNGDDGARPPSEASGAAIMNKRMAQLP